MDTAARDKEPVYTTTTSIDRTFFLLDLHRLRSEGDTLENALVVYRPEADLKRVGPGGDDCSIGCYISMIYTYLLKDETTSLHYLLELQLVTLLPAYQPY